MAIVKPPNKAIGDIERYLQLDLYEWLQNLVDGTLNFNFSENFVSFIAKDIVIASGETASIPNGFLSQSRGLIPTQRIIVRQVGNGVLTDGDWTREYVEIKNNGAEEVTASIVFLWER